MIMRFDEEVLGLVMMCLGAMIFTIALAWAWTAH